MSCHVLLLAEACAPRLYVAERDRQWLRAGSTVLLLAQANSSCKAKDRLHIEALTNYYTRGKGPDNKPMSEDEVCVCLFSASQVAH